MQDNLTPFIEFRGAGKQYDGKYAVRDLDLYIDIQGRHPIGGQNAPGWEWAQPPLPANNPTDKQ